MTKELIEQIKQDVSVSEYVLNHYWEMSKEDLRDIIQELQWVAIGYNYRDEEEFNNCVISSLLENHVDDED